LSGDIFCDFVDCIFIFRYMPPEKKKKEKEKAKEYTLKPYRHPLEHG
jgi:hypothetical protein